MRSSRLLLPGVLLLVALAAALARELNNERITRLPKGDPSAGWFSYDPDTLYHARRVERLLAEGWESLPRDPWLSFPSGAPIPWPPYYTLALAAALGPFAPEEPAARADFLERGVASLAWPCGVLTAVLAAAAAWRLARGAENSRRGLVAALVAGGVYSLHGNSLHYSAPGNGDHHAWAALWMTASFALIAEGCGRARSSDRRGALALGLAAGAAAGVLVGSWVGGLVYVLVIQAALGWLVVRAGREPLPGLPHLGLGFHAAAALALAPAVRSSSWKDEQPWMVVNLSWFHLALLALGALVFLPLFAWRHGSRALRAWPWIVLAALCLLGLCIATLDLPLARGVREGFAWAGRGNEFMPFVVESQPLLWGFDGSFAALARELGYAPLLLLPVWLAGAWRALRRGELELVVWVLAVPPLAVQALLQRRFADALGPPMAVLLGWGLARALSGLRRTWSPRLPIAAAALGAVCVLEAPSIARLWTRTLAGEHWLRGPQAATFRAQRAVYSWIGEQPPAPGGEPRSVLASWYHGHPLEWVARRPTVATNFGSYVGLESYLAPWRFFLEEDHERAEALLEQHRVRHVLVDGSLTNDLEVMLRILRRDERGTYLVRTSEGIRPSARWYGTLGARLLFEGRAVQLSPSSASDSLDFLRLVHISPDPYALPIAIPYLPASAGIPPCGWVWEHVPGARLEVHGTHGEELRVTLELAYPGRERRLVWTRATLVGADGLARLRIPYCTDAPNGDARATGPARWSFVDRDGTLDVSEEAVLLGRPVSLR